MIDNIDLGLDSRPSFKFQYRAVRGLWVGHRCRGKSLGETSVKTGVNRDKAGSKIRSSGKSADQQ